MAFAASAYVISCRTRTRPGDCYGEACAAARTPARHRRQLSLPRADRPGGRLVPNPLHTLICCDFAPPGRRSWNFISEKFLQPVFEAHFSGRAPPASSVFEPSCPRPRRRRSSLFPGPAAGGSAPRKRPSRGWSSRGPSAGEVGEPAAVRLGFGDHGLGNFDNYSVISSPIRECARARWMVQVTLRLVLQQSNQRTNEHLGEPMRRYESLPHLDHRTKIRPR